MDHYGSRLSRRQLVVGAGAASLGLLAGCRRWPGQAQPPSVAHIGWLGPGWASDPNFQELREGLRELDWVEGQNLVLEARWAEGRLEQLPAFAADLVRLQPDVIV